MPLLAQDFEILSVESLPADMSAREEIKTDHNDRQCALFRVATQNIAPNQREGFSFKTDLGSEVVERASRNGEIWLWVSPGLKYLRIMHGEWGQYELRLQDHVPRVEALHTYKITIMGTPRKSIYGSLNVESVPDFSMIFIDGEKVGETPKYFSEILVGTHKVKVAKEGYADYYETVTIKKGELKQLSATLSNVSDVSFHCNVNNVRLKIDGEEYRNANGTYKLTYGSHRIEAEVEGYKAFSQTINVNERTLRFDIEMRKNAPTGAICGLFSVSATQQVYFSKGNLQYRASTNTWRFAEHQWDYVGDANSNISQTYSGWIDLFGWGTSGYNHGAGCYQPWSTSQTKSDYYAYGQSTNNLYDQTGQADWGYNPISNGGDTENTWRTLTHEEWVYVFNTRNTPSGIRYAKAKVNNINGVILLPDDWQSVYYSLSRTNSPKASFSSNTITATQWATLEQHGAVFLPAAGFRYGTSVYDVGSYGNYWSASYSNSYYVAWYVRFSGSRLRPDGYGKRYCGPSVRLVLSPQ